jgi:hypothetical protein
MDCELFDKLVIDRVFAELDDLTSGAVQRHVAHCSRCRSIESGLRAAREVVVLAAPDLPPGFIENIVALERSTRTRLPLPQRVGRTVSVLSGYAMRPQLTMGALLLLMIGSSLFLLRARPGDRELVHVTERGVPEGEVEAPTNARPHIELAAAATALGPQSRESSGQRSDSSTVASAGSTDSPPGLLAAAKAAFREGRYAEAHELSERIIQAGGGETAQAALLSASALARDAGCAAALARFEALRSRHGRSVVGDEAAWNAAECHQSLGRFDRARQLYEELRASSVWGQRARERLRGGRQAPAPATSAEAMPSPASAP